jgi:proteasomal ATPase-associated factor 1
MDVTPGGELGLSGGNEGTVRIWHTRDGIMRRDLKGHIGDINVAKWFPSGKVALTGGQDLQLKIWDAMTGLCAATLKGHSRAVSDAVMIDRGRNLISCSQDGTALLWDVPTQKSIGSYGSAEHPANSCWLHAGQRPAGCQSTEQGEESDHGNILVANEGGMHGWDVRTKQKLFQWAVAEALNCCLMDGADNVWAGGQEGGLFRWDLRTQTLVETVKRSVTPILSLAIPRDAWVPAQPSQQEVPLSGQQPANNPVNERARQRAAQEKTLWVGTSDGVCFEWSIEGKRVCCDFSGSDCDPINSMVVLNDYGFVACGDGAIRKYKIN